MNDNHRTYIAAKAALAKMTNVQKVLIQERTRIDCARNYNFNAQFCGEDNNYDPLLDMRLVKEYEEAGEELLPLNAKVKLATEYIAAALGVLYVLNGTDIRKENINRSNFVKDRLFTLLSDLDNLPGLDNGVESSDQFIADVSLLAAHNRDAFKHSL